MGYGIGGHLGICFQQSFGTAYTASHHYFPVLNETMMENKPPIMSEVVKTSFAKPNVYEGFNEIGGGAQFNAHPILIGKLLTAWCGQSSGTLSTSHYTHEIVPKDSDFDDKSATPPMTVEVYRNAGSAHQYQDCNMNVLTLEIAHNALISVGMEVVGADFAKVAKQTAAYLTGSEFVYDQSSFSLNGAACGDIKTCTITLNNNLEAVGTLDTTKKPNRIKRTSYRTVEISGAMLFEDDTELDLFRAQTEHRWLITVTGQEVSSGYNAELIIDIPSFRYVTYPPNISGPGLLEVPFQGTAEYNSGSGHEIKFTNVNTVSQYLE